MSQLCDDCKSVCDALSCECVKDAIGEYDELHYANLCVDCGGDVRTFYLGMNYDPKLAQVMIRALEKATGDHCTSRWPFTHETGLKASVAAADVEDLKKADYVILVPLSKTSRGTHVEMGIALALNKLCYLYRPSDIEGVPYDLLCQRCPDIVKNTIERVLKEHGK